MIATTRASTALTWTLSVSFQLQARQYLQWDFFFLAQPISIYFWQWNFALAITTHNRHSSLATLISRHKIIIIRGFEAKSEHTYKECIALTHKRKPQNCTFYRTTRRNKRQRKVRQNPFFTLLFATKQENRTHECISYITCFLPFRICGTGLGTLMHGVLRSYAQFKFKW